jgi:uroporphyrinogen decarboxylase
MRYIKAQQEAGAHAIWFGDCNAFSGLLSPEQYTEHVFPITKELVDYAEKELDVMIWMHNSEISIPHVLSHIPLGLSFESIGPAADIVAMRAATKGKHAISGNLDPIEVLWRGTPESVTAEAERIMNICKPGGGYIFNTGEMNPMQVPAENMRAFIQAGKRLAQY